MHNETSDPASGILKCVISAVHQADVLQYDSECSFAALSVGLWGRCVLCFAQLRDYSTWAVVAGGGAEYVCDNTN